jgi:exoribonuclease R
VVIEKNEKKPFTIFDENDEEKSEKNEKETFTIFNENDNDDEKIDKNKISKNEKKEVNNFEIYSDDKKTEKTDHKKPVNVPFVIFDENNGKKNSISIYTDEKNENNAHEKSHKKSEKSDDKIIHKTPGADSRIRRGLAQPEKPDTDELDDILTAMGILDSEDGTINTRLARYLYIYIHVYIYTYIYMYI